MKASKAFGGCTTTVDILALCTKLRKNEEELRGRNKFLLRPAYTRGWQYHAQLRDRYYPTRGQEYVSGSRHSSLQNKILL